MPYTVEMSPPNPKQWLEEMFEYEYCCECGGDACHHTAVTAAGLPFARCDYPADDNGAYHPVIRQYHDMELSEREKRTALDALWQERGKTNGQRR